MKKTLLALALATVMATSLLRPVGAEELLDVVETDAASYVLMDQETGRVLVGKNIHDRLEPASVTKIMTMLLVVEALDAGTISKEDVVTASDHAASMGGSQIYLEPGETMTVDDLLKAVAVVSANDGAVALAEYLAGSEAAFVERMNARAAELGMEDTTFVNCNGLPAEGHLTCAYDIALMSRALMTHSRIQDYTTIWMDTLREGTFTLSNTNRLIKTYSGITGLKTGYTDSARYCLSATAQREGMGLIATVLGASTSQLRFDTAAQLMDYGFATYSLVTVEPEEPLSAVPVRGGEETEVQAVLTGSPKLLLAKAQASQVSTRVELEPEVTAPVAAGDPVGTLVVYVGDQVEERLTLTAAEPVARLTFPTLFFRLFTRMGMRE